MYSICIACYPHLRGISYDDDSFPADFGFGGEKDALDMSSRQRFFDNSRLYLSELYSLRVACTSAIVDLMEGFVQRSARRMYL